MRGCVAGFLLLCALEGITQNKQLLYNLEDIPQTLLSNPGSVISFDKHLGIPLLSGISVEIGSSGVSAYDIFREDIGINDAIDKVINELTEKDYFTINQQLEILSFGWKEKFSEIYFSGGLYQETDAILYFPNDIVTLAYRGNADFIDVPFELEDLVFTAEALTVYHFGVNKKINDKWQIGARAKVYMSIANVNSIDNGGDFTTVTTPDGPNFYTHRLRNASLGINSSGLAASFDGNQETQSGGFVGSALWSGNKGIGADLGFTYFINDQWTVTGSLIDIGFIRHRKDILSSRATANFETNGIELEFPAILEGEETTEYWQILQDEFESQVTLNDSIRDPYTTTRPLKVNASLQYAYGKNFDGDACNCRGSKNAFLRNKLGIHLYSIKRPRGFQTALTAYYDKIWNSFLRTRLTYTIDRRSNTNVGLLISTQINKFNLYLATDNLVNFSDLSKARGASLQLGMQLTFDSK